MRAFVARRDCAVKGVCFELEACLCRLSALEDSTYGPHPLAVPHVLKFVAGAGVVSMVKLKYSRVSVEYDFEASRPRPSPLDARSPSFAALGSGFCVYMICIRIPKTIID